MRMDQYKELYKKETEQIHAPAELIAKTKAAMRVEEARIRRESAVKKTGTEEKLTSVSKPPMGSADGRNYGKRHNIRKWAYPLTAAAALLILVSVSAMMRGLKSGDMSMSGAPSSDTAMDMESSEMSDGEGFDGGMAAAGAAMDRMEAAEITEGASADEMTSAESDMAASPAAENENMSDEIAAADWSGSDTVGFTESVEEAAAEKAESEEAPKNEGQRKSSDTEKSMAKDTAQSGVSESAGVTIERVAKKPDFCGRSDIERHIFEGQIFLVAEEADGWAAYAETKDGSKYVIRGEAQDLETFLEMGCRKLAEQ